MIKAQCVSAARELIFQIRSSPINDGHEIIANSFNPALGQILHRDRPIIDIFFMAGAGELNVFMYGDALNHCPFKRGEIIGALFDQGLMRANGV